LTSGACARFSPILQRASPPKSSVTLAHPHPEWVGVYDAEGNFTTLLSGFHVTCGG